MGEESVRRGLRTVERQRGRRWLVRKNRHLRLEPLCRHCAARGVVTAAAEVDHVLALTNGGQDTDENLQSLCADCHKAKTAVDLGYTPRTRVGYDGWPVAADDNGGRRGRGE